MKYGARKYQGRSTIKLAKGLEKIRIKIRKEKHSALEKTRNVEQVYVVEEKEIVIFVWFSPDRKALKYFEDILKKH